MIFNKDILAKAKLSKSVEEIKELYITEGSEMTDSEANILFNKLNYTDMSISDDELHNVAGGACYKNGCLVVSSDYSCNYFKCSSCGNINSPALESKERCVCKKYLIKCQNCDHYYMVKNLYLCGHPANRQ